MTTATLTDFYKIFNQSMYLAQKPLGLCKYLLFPSRFKIVAVLGHFSRYGQTRWPILTKLGFFR